MINCIKDTTSYKNITINKQSHAVLFFSTDYALNNEVALTYAKSLLCSSHNACGKCDACKQFDSKSHPDFVLLNQDSIKVEDVNKMMDKLNTMPISAEKKVFVVLNIENMNETAQNKLLKSLEEPNDKCAFIITTAKTDKVLPTILSRLSKNYVEQLSVEDKHLVCEELKRCGTDISKNLGFDSLTQMLSLSDPSYQNTLLQISKMFDQLQSTADIPKVVSSLGDINKHAFLPLMQEMFLSALHQDQKFDKQLLAPLLIKYSQKALTRCLPLIQDAYKKQMSNVNLNYILDTLLFNILKEKYLCK